jgi:hypothetical protein
MQKVLREWLGALKFPQGVRVSIDIDPIPLSKGGLHRRPSTNHAPNGRIMPQKIQFSASPIEIRVTPSMASNGPLAINDFSGKVTHRNALRISQTI